VTEGTWLRLDVSPTGDIIFDMLGDLYCLPSAEVSAAGGAAVTARPVLLGVPYDSNPTFSPNGDRIAFKSDAGLGLENIWVKPWSGCVAADLRPAKGRGSTALKDALYSKAFDEHLLSQGIEETNERRVNRLIREGRYDGLFNVSNIPQASNILPVQRVTNETYRWLSEPRFHPDGTHLIATKWYTSSRSLGAGEGWKYAVPEPRDNKTIAVGSGTRVLGRSLPRGWTNEQYGDQQIGPEQFIWRGEDSVIFSKNIRDEYEFSYSKGISHERLFRLLFLTRS
jgi:hypothetical protein